MAEFEQANLNLVADVFAMDEFQKIAIAELLRELPDGFVVPEPDSREEKILMEIGRVVSEGYTPDEFWERMKGLGS